MRKLGALASVMALALLVACKPVTTGVRLAGSTSIQPVADRLAEAYMKSGGGRVSVQAIGSTAGVMAVQEGIAEIGMVSRSLTRAESDQGLVQHIIGYDVLTIVVHPSNPVNNLIREQVRGLFEGRLNNWSQVNGRPGRVNLIAREAGSGSREAFQSLIGPTHRLAVVLPSSGFIRVGVMHDPNAIGYVSLGVVNRLGAVKALVIDGKRPGETGYPLIRPLLFVTRGKPTREAEAFIRFVRGPAGRRVIAEEGLVPVE